MIVTRVNERRQAVGRLDPKSRVDAHAADSNHTFQHARKCGRLILGVRFSASGSLNTLQAAPDLQSQVVRGTIEVACKPGDYTTMQRSVETTTAGQNQAINVRRDRTKERARTGDDPPPIRTTAGVNLSRGANDGQGVLLH